MSSSAVGFALVGDTSTRHFELDDSKSVVRIGRGPKNDVVLPFGGVSWSHLELKATHGKLSVRDISQNGTAVELPGLPGASFDRVAKDVETPVPDGARIMLPVVVKPRNGENPDDLRANFLVRMDVPKAKAPAREVVDSYILGSRPKAVPRPVGDRDTNAKRRAEHVEKKPRDIENPSETYEKRDRKEKDGRKRGAVQERREASRGRDRSVLKQLKKVGPEEQQVHEAKVPSLPSDNFLGLGHHRETRLPETASANLGSGKGQEAPINRSVTERSELAGPPMSCRQPVSFSMGDSVLKDGTDFERSSHRVAISGRTDACKVASDRSLGAQKQAVSPGRPGRDATVLDHVISKPDEPRVSDTDASRPLPSWVTERNRCQWWSESQKRMFPVRISAIDKGKKLVFATFEHDAKIWKSIPFSLLVRSSCPLRKTGSGPPVSDGRRFLASGMGSVCGVASTVAGLSDVRAISNRRGRSRSRSPTPQWWCQELSDVFAGRPKQVGDPEKEEKTKTEQRRKEMLEAEQRKVEEAFEKRKREAEAQKLRDRENEGDRRKKRPSRRMFEEKEIQWPQFT